ncbi:MAG: hypothetical protein D6753_00845 [Planctomycetota bacterium]|nr:MAG: hypothetical protein D6753_00845 [Planctomycetota bacterium]
MLLSIAGLKSVAADLPLTKNRIEQLNESFHTRSADYSSLLWMLVAVGICLAMGVGAYVAYKFLASRRTNSDEQLFLELCRAHKLNRKQTGLLKGFAKVSAISNPAVLFVDPALWVLDPKIHTRYCGETGRRQVTVLKRILFEIDA